jgi:hypothetical protein
MADSTATSGGIGLGGVLFVIFLILKLTGVISWSWWWVFAPIWIPIAIILLFLIAFLFIRFIAGD